VFITTESAAMAIAVASGDLREDNC
jgi:hypothetical protein